MCTTASVHDNLSISGEVCSLLVTRKLDDILSIERLFSSVGIESENVFSIVDKRNLILEKR